MPNAPKADVAIDIRESIVSMNERPARKPRCCLSRCALVLLVLLGLIFGLSFGYLLVHWITTTSASVEQGGIVLMYAMMQEASSLIEMGKYDFKRVEVADQPEAIKELGLTIFESRLDINQKSIPLRLVQAGSHKATGFANVAIEPAAVMTYAVQSVYKPDVILEIGATGAFEHTSEIAQVYIGKEVQYLDRRIAIPGCQGAAEYGQRQITYNNLEPLRAYLDKKAKQGKDIGLVDIAGVPGLYEQGKAVLKHHVKQVKFARIFTGNSLDLTGEDLYTMKVSQNSKKFTLEGDGNMFPKSIRDWANEFYPLSNPIEDDGVSEWRENIEALFGPNDLHNLKEMEAAAVASTIDRMEGCKTKVVFIKGVTDHLFKATGAMFMQNLLKCQGALSQTVVDALQFFEEEGLEAI